MRSPSAPYQWGKMVTWDVQKGSHSFEDICVKHIPIFIHGGLGPLFSAMADDLPGVQQPPPPDAAILQRRLSSS